jgi:hypothetical protein
MHFNVILCFWAHLDCCTLFWTHFRGVEIYLPGPPQTNWTSIFSERRIFYFQVIETDTATMKVSTNNDNNFGYEKLGFWYTICL